MSGILSRIINKLFQAPWILYAFFLLLVILLKWSFMAMPPVWDEAFSIFPAADFLVRHGFNYSLLLTQSGYHEGGPTAHALSLLTLVTAFILKITGGGKPAWVLLHLLQFLMVAGIGALLARIYATLFDRIPALLLSVATLCYPLMMVQAGYMYIEVPLLFFTLLAFYHYRKDRIWICSLFLLCACLTKASGVIGVGAMVLLMFLENTRPLRETARKAVILATPSALGVLAQMSITGYSKSLSQTISSSADFQSIIDTILRDNLLIYQGYISHMPEMIIILAESILLSIFFLAQYFSRNKKAGSEKSGIIIFNSLLILSFCVFHFIIFALIQKSDTHFLSRYLFYIIPSMFLMIYYPIDQAIKKTGVKALLLAAVTMVCVINRQGMLYPSIPYSSIAMAERSEEYINGYQVQRDYINLIEHTIQPNVPVYVNLPDYFLTQYAVSGYVSRPLPNVYFIGDVLQNKGRRFRYPDHFVLVYSYPWLGGETIQMMANHFAGNKYFSVQITGYFNKGDFTAYVATIRNIAATGANGH